MEHAQSLCVITGFLVIGMVFGKIPAVNRAKKVYIFSTISLYALLFFMGFRLGRNPEVEAQLSSIGTLSLFFAISTVCGTVVMLLALYLVFIRRRAPEKQTPSTTFSQESVPRESTARERRSGESTLQSTRQAHGETESRSAAVFQTEPPSPEVEREPRCDISAFKQKPPSPEDSRSFKQEPPSPSTPTEQKTALYIWEPIKLVIVVIIGFSIGFLLPWSSLKGVSNFTGENMTSYLLYVLLFFIGIDLTRSGVNIRRALAHPETVLLPLGTIIGSLAGGFILSRLISLSWGKALALSAGFGWYSLSGVIITDLGDPVLGSVGFMANLFRESIALLFIPLIGKTRFPHIGIGIAGATSMDVTLPLIQRTCGPTSVPLSISSGAVLSLLVPVFVPFFYQFGA